MIETQDVTFADIPPNRHVISFMGTNGDTKIHWDPNVPAEVEAARRQFEHLTKKEKYNAWHMDDQDRQGERLREFDPQARRMLMTPQNVGG